MRKIQLGKSNLQVPVMAVGCMRINQLDKSKAERFIKTALDEGANFFDHADVLRRRGLRRNFRRRHRYERHGSRKGDFAIQMRYPKRHRT